MKPIVVPAIALAALLGLSACTSGTGTSSDTGAEQKTLTVFAAASLTEVFADIGEEFTEENPGVRVDYSFAGSSDLVSQITEGAPADVIATADEKTMTTLADDGLLSDTPELFAGNTLALAVQKGNPKAITSSKDLTGKDLVVCAPQVPCGAATATWAEQNDVALTPVSEENSVTDVLGKVSSGQADAGIVYVTDVTRAQGDVEQVDLDGADTVVNLYPAAAVKGSENQSEAEAFVTFLGSETARDILRDAGFAPAPSGSQ